jgi:hypothetical protein
MNKKILVGYLMTLVEGYSTLPGVRGNQERFDFIQRRTSDIDIHFVDS